MVPRPKARPQSLLQAVNRTSCLTSQTSQTTVPLRPSQSRHLHSVPSLNTEKDAIFARYGVPGLFSKPTYNETWLQYQTHLVSAVNSHVRGTTDESHGLQRLHEITSKQRSKAVLYNLAAQAHHNHFFFQSLSHRVNPDPPSHQFQGLIEEWFESIDHLGEELIDNALSMFGNGYIWLLVENDSTKTLRILCTYNAGSPFPGAHTRQQSLPANSGGADSIANRLSQVTNQAGSFGGATIQGQATHFTGAFVGTPILCLKMWEHQYMRDYGLMGKEDYATAWWKRVDWAEVQKRYNEVSNTTGRDENVRWASPRFDAGP